MTNKTKILVPLDFSRTAAHTFRFALHYGTLINAELHLLHVMYRQMENLDQPLASATSATTEKRRRVEKKLEVFVNEQLAHWQDSDKSLPRIYRHVEVGSTIAVIKSQVKLMAYDLIIMGTRDKHEAFENRLGTVSSDVVGNTNCPVIVVPRQFEYRPLQRIAHAIEPKSLRVELIAGVTEQLLPRHMEAHLVWFGNATDLKASQKLEALNLSLRQQFSELKIETHCLRRQELVADTHLFIDQAGIDLLIMYRSPGGLLHRLFHRSHTRLMARYIHIPLLVI